MNRQNISVQLKQNYKVNKIKSYNLFNRIFFHFVNEQKLKKIDFIKVDIDGHEPLFLEGAWEVIEQFNTIVLLEISHENYLNAGYTAWDFYDILKEKKFKIYSEQDLTEIKTKRDFLHRCGNFTHSANIIISKNKINV